MSTVNPPSPQLWQPIFGSWKRILAFISALGAVIGLLTVDQVLRPYLHPSLQGKPLWAWLSGATILIWAILCWAPLTAWFCFHARRLHEAPIQSLQVQLSEIATTINRIEHSLADSSAYEIVGEFLAINELYRDHLNENLGQPFHDDLVRAPFLQEICAHIADIYKNSYGVADPVVTVKRAVADDAYGVPATVYTFARNRPCPALRKF